MWKACLLFVALLSISHSAYGECAPKPLYGITYAPLALDNDNICLPVEQVKKDMELIAQLANSVRIYNIAVCFENAVEIFKAAKQYNMTVLMGLWMEGGNPTVFEYEIGALPYFMEHYSDIIEYVIVGNEPLFIEEIEVEVVIDAVVRVKEMLIDLGYSHQVSVAEVWPTIESEIGPEFVSHLDFVCMNMQPYWEGFYAECPPDLPDCVSAGEYIHLKALGLQEWLNKTVVLCEAGWPTDGEPCCSGERDNALSGFHAIPSIENAIAFVNNFVQHASRREVMYYLHTSFDEEWKKIWDPCDECKGKQVSKFSKDECNGCVVDYKWGFYDFERQYKEGYTLPDPKPQCDYY